MKDQLQSIRDFLVAYNSFGRAEEALTALSQLEAMVGEQEPVMFAFQYDDGTWHGASMTEHSAGMKPLFTTPPAQQPQYEAGDMASAAAQGFRDGVASVTQPQVEVGNSGFDHKTAADFLSGKTVSDEAVRKFVQASRWAHDDRASLQSLLLSVRNELASREAEIALLKKELMEAEAAPQQAKAVPPTHVLVPVELLNRVLDSEEVNDMADASDELRAMLAAAKKEAGHE